jgi:hypothetical protein
MYKSGGFRFLHHFYKANPLIWLYAGFRYHSATYTYHVEPPCLEVLNNLPDRSNKFHPHVNQKFSNLRQSAKKRGREFNLTKERLTQVMQEPCYYCNASLGKPNMSIDRMDNKKGYLDSNIVSACLPCNVMKKTYTSEQFMKNLAIRADSLRIAKKLLSTAVTV